MEEDPRYFHLKSELLKKSSIQKQIDKLKDVIEIAEERISYDAAHNAEILHAIDSIENFLRKKKRVCYGGTAINALLPTPLKFYDERTDLPDYDFFTPEPEKDIESIVVSLKKEGFQDVVERIGMHEGTYKILVNFVPIADITYIDPSLYKKIYQRSVVKGGIHYCDADFLRMMMYLELSRPRGQVERWEKVFERLTLLNNAIPVKPCKASIDELVGRVHIPEFIRKKLLDYIIDNKRVLVGADVVGLYDWILKRRMTKTPKMSWFLKRNGMMVFLSPDANTDAKYIKELLGNDSITIDTMKAHGELVSERVVVSYRSMPLVLIVQEMACHSYNTLPMSSGKNLLVGTLETMITLYYSLEFFTDDKNILQFLMLCLCQRLVEMSEALHRRGSSESPFPVFSIECSGYQKGYATLLKEKFSRIQREKKKRKNHTHSQRQIHSKKTRKLRI